MELNYKRTFGLVVLGIAGFHLAYQFKACSFLILLYLFCLAGLARQRTNRRAFYLGLAIGMLAYGPQLSCFYAIFGPAAIVLWLVLAFWIGLFGLLSRLCLVHCGPAIWLIVSPFLWTGLEYFRSELYFLRFTWLNAGFAFSEHVNTVPFSTLGVYGIGFVLMLAACAVHFWLMRVRARSASVETSEPLASNVQRIAALSWPPRAPAATGGLLATGALAVWTNGPLLRTQPPLETNGVAVAGIQMEFPGDPQVMTALNRVKKQCPQAPLIVLSEYTFTDPLPDYVRKWCRENQRYLIVGGKDFVTDQKFFDTAFVIDPRGEVVFRQAKSVPIQFFNDGLPAREQALWNSPWGKIGICICYDLSYSQVADRLVRLGAQALIVPTMDVIDWGKHEHELHARVAPVRAAEYGLPIFRVASSGISQLIERRGAVLASAPFPGEEAIVSGWLDIGPVGRIPLDRVWARVAVAVTVLFVASLMIGALKLKLSRQR
jgi:apolipoprotein N-acyltransferase